MRRIARRPTALVLAALAAAACAASASAAFVTSWVNPAGGTFGTAGNWSLGAPGSADSALFDLDAAYLVAVDVPTDVARVLVRSGAVTLDVSATLHVVAPTATIPSVIVGQLAGDDGVLSIAAGTLSAAFVHIADVPGAVGAIEAIGAGALDASDVVHVGRRGAGSLDVTLASAAVRRLTLGSLSTGAGAATISASSLVVDETLIVGQSGVGALEIVDGSTAASGDVLIAQNYLSTGAVVVDDASTLNIVGSLDVARGGVGALEIRGGSQVSCSSFLSVATLPATFFPPRFPDSEGTVVVSGPGSLLHVAGTMHVPGLGFATLDVGDGGQVVVDADLNFNVPERATVVTRFDVAGGDALIAVHDLAKAGQSDPVAVTVELAEGIVPAGGQHYDLLRAASITAAFAPTLPALPAGLTWQFGVVGVGSDQVLRARIVDAADINGDGLVDGADLGLLLADWGGAGAGDLNGDGTVDGADLGLLLGAFGGATP